MKKIFSIITIITALFLILSCGSNLHNADVMYVDKVVVQGLTDLVGQEMVISGNWILGKDGTSTWVHGLGDTTKVADGAIGTVGADGSVEFKINQLTSEAELRFIGKVNEDGWSDPHRFGAFAYKEKEGDKEHAIVTNTFTGSDVPKTILGVVQADESIVWTVVDAIAENRVKIDEIIVVGLPAGYNDESVEFFGFVGNDIAAPTAEVADGVVSVSFLSPVTLRSDDVEFFLQVVGTPAMRIAENVDDVLDSVASIANPKTGEKVLKIYGIVEADNSITWSIRPAAVKQIVGWEIVTGIANSSYVMNGPFAGWGLGWDKNNPTLLKTNASGNGARTFASPYAVGPDDQFTGVILKADGSDADWDVDRLRADGAQIAISAMDGYDAADFAAANLDAIDFTIVVTSTGPNNWTWKITK